eukprot:361352-Chlamydomonas_euryale.AAC.1
MHYYADASICIRHGWRYARYIFVYGTPGIYLFMCAGERGGSGHAHVSAHREGSVRAPVRAALRKTLWPALPPDSPNFDPRN